MDTVKEVIRKLDFLILEGNNCFTEMDLNENSDIVDDLFYDSINIVSLIVGIEEEFDIQIPDDKLDFEFIKKYRLLKELVVSLIDEKGEKNE